MVEKIILCLVTLPFLLCISCEYSDSVGLGLVEEEQFDMVFLDTTTVKISTVLFDSLPTSGTDSVLVGHHADEMFGTITARFFFQVGLDSLDDYPDEDKADYQRISLVLPYGNYSYYDTTQIQTYYLYRVTEDMEYQDDHKLYNNDQFAYDTTKLIGSLSQYLRPHRNGDAVEMPLDDSLGIELFTLAQQEDDLLDSETDFLLEYPGFVLVPDPANTAIIGFSSDTHIKIDYLEGGEEKELIFPVSDNIYFTQLLHDRSQTPFTALQQQRYELPVEETGQLAFVQGGVGTAIRIEFPYLKSLLTIGNGVYVTEAYLRLNPIINTFGGATPLPSNLSVYRVDGLNRIVGTYDSTFIRYIDREFKEDTYYSLPVSGFLNTQLSTNEDNENALLIVLPEGDYYATVDRMVVGGAMSEDPTILELFLLKNYQRQ